MTPKEKAKELVNKFREFADGIDSETDRFSPNIEKKNGKQCALIAVDLLIEEIRSRYWYDVKNEIENL